MSIADIANQLTYRPKERLTLFRSLSLPEQSATIVLLSPYIQQEIMRQLSVHEAVNVLDHLDLITAESIVKHIKDTKRRDRITAKLKQDLRDKIELFVQFHPKATESLVHLNYLLVPTNTTINEVGQAIDEHHFETGRFPEVLVQDRGQLLGYVPMSVLVRERNSTQVGKFVKPLLTLSYQSEPSTVLEALSSQSHQKAVILDDDGSVLGLIYADDVNGLFGKLPAETLYSVSGVDQGELPHDAVMLKVRSRYKWLILNLVTCFAAGSVIFWFEDTIEQIAMLAIYIPIIAGMGSNVGSQTFAVMLRGLVMGTVSWKNGAKVIRNELLAATVTGTLIGCLVAIVSFVVYGSWLLGIVVALSLIGVHIVGGAFGAFIPLLLKRYGVDPAGVTTILLTTATDIFGLFFLLGLGTWLLL